MESRDLVVDQVLVEYQAYCTGQLSERLGTTEAPDGAVEYCGDEDDPAHWAICYVRASDGVVRPLVVGQRERILAEFSAMDRRGMPFWDALLFPPPVAVIGGHEYPFKAAGGRHLLGVVKLDRQAVLLAAADDRLVAVLVHDGVATTFPLGRPGALREVDVDLMRSFSRPTTIATTKPPDDPLRPSPRTKAHHIRIVPGRRVELGGGPTVAEVLEAAFAHIEARATTPPKKPLCRKKPAAVGKAASPAAATAPKRPTLIGKKAAPYVLGYLRRMALRGCGDLVGLTGDIIRAIQVHFKDFKITGEAFADALKRIAATGTCLIAPRDNGGRIWEIKLAGLNDPTSAHHLRLCRETRSRVRLEEAAANQQGAAPMTSKGRTSGEDSDKGVAVDTHAAPTAAMDGSSHAMDPSVEGPGDAVATSDANESASPDERSTPPDPDVHAQHPGCAAAPASSTTTSAERRTAEVVPACLGSATAAQAEALDLVVQLDMNPIGWFMLLLWCLMQMVEDVAVASDGGEGGENDEPRAEGEPTPTAASDGVVHAECASTGDDAVATIEAQAQGNAPICVGRMLNLYRSLWRWTRPSPHNVALRASLLEAPTLHRHHAFAPVQREPRSRDRGTRGPRGPPHAPRLTQPNDARSAVVCRGRR